MPRLPVDQLDAGYVWPRTLRRPAPPAKLIYLDLNHWVSLAKAQTGHREGVRHQEALDHCVAAVEDRSAVFPISDTIYFEISKIRSYRQRRDLREAIERVSRFMVVTARSVVSVHEIEALLDKLVGVSSDPINTMDYLDWGVFRAFGRVGGLRVRTIDGDDATEELRAQYSEGPEAFDAVLTNAELELNRKMIEGPSPDEEPQLRELGWNPRSAFDVLERRARQEIDQVRRFDKDPGWRGERIRDVVAAREVLIEINESLFKGLSDRGTTFELLFPRPDVVRRALNSMPSFDVAVSVKTAYHRDASHHWRTNDISDIDAIGSTLPYCDVVVTDKAAARAIEQSGVAERLGTVALSQLSDLLGQI
ncbi:MAG: hypothetical protein M3198_14025 [Actinomycetota bacterium]|nr:hypothetical protein [Actinomycetota bacterium]